MSAKGFERCSNTTPWEIGGFSQLLGWRFLGVELTFTVELKFYTAEQILDSWKLMAGT